MGGLIVREDLGLAAGGVGEGAGLLWVWAL